MKEISKLFIMLLVTFLSATISSGESLIPVDSLSQHYGDHGNITAITLAENSIPEINSVEFYKNSTQAIATPDYLIYIGIVKDLKPMECGNLVEFSSGDYRYFQKGFEPQPVRLDPNPNYGYFEKGRVNIIIQKFRGSMLYSSNEQPAIQELRVVVPSQYQQESS